MELPTTTLPATRRNPSTLVLYGGYKVGKSTVLGQLKDCLTIVADPKGHDFISSMRVQVNNMAEFDDACRAVLAAKAGPSPYKRVAIDTLTQIEDWCEDEATKLYKASAMGVNFKGSTVLMLPDGAGYAWLRKVFEARLNIIKQLAEEVIVICHLKDMVRDDKLKAVNAGEVSQANVDLVGKNKKAVCAQFDSIGFLNRRPAPTATDPRATALWVSFKTSETVSCGSRSEHLRGNEFEFAWEKIYID